jgi:hypothetical protein
MSGLIQANVSKESGLVSLSPGAAKGWVMIEQNGTKAGGGPDYNIFGISDTGTGDRTVVWDTDFSSANYVMLSTAAGGSSMYHMTCPGAALASWAVGSVQVLVIRDNGYNGSVNLLDEAHCVIAFGDQI